MYYLLKTPPSKLPTPEEITINTNFIKEQLEDRQIGTVIQVALHMQLELSEEVIHSDAGAVFPCCCRVLQWGVWVRVLLSHLKHQVQQLALSCTTASTN